MDNFDPNVKDFVYYEDFGAVGDGKRDDFPAIREAHAFANEHRLPVKAKPSRIYYIGASPESAIIMTDTDWNSARFIVDDTDVLPEYKYAHIFEVKSRLEPVELASPPRIRKGQQRIDIQLAQNALIVAVNGAKKQFMRKGLNVNSGFDQTDCFIADQTGAILTPVIWDFENVDSLTAYPIDERALSLTGGEFTTISTKYSQEEGYNYFSRDISITRSNVIVSGLVHHVADEPADKGSPYSGFARTHACAYIQFRDCHFFGHKFYSTIGAAGLPVSMGTYDINLHTSIDVKFINCRQDNILDAARWGVIGSNGCKDILLDGCVFSRIDAHMNVANLTVRDTTLGVQGFNAIGHGKLTIENTTIMGPAVVSLRGDYGSSWDGDLYIKNVVWYPPERVAGNPCLIVANNSGGHDFGYPCSFPHKIVIENLRVMDNQYGGRHECVSVFGGIGESNTEISGFGTPALKTEGAAGESGEAGDYPLLSSEKLIASGLSTESGKGFRLWSDDVNKCYCTQPYEIDKDAKLWPNFRAELTDVDRFIYDVDSSGDRLLGEHSLAPDIRIADCPRVVVRAGGRPARLFIRDCALEETDLDEGGSGNGSEDGDGCVITYERVKGVK